MITMMTISKVVRFINRRLYKLKKKITKTKNDKTETAYTFMRREAVQSFFSK